MSVLQINSLIGPARSVRSAATAAATNHRLAVFATLSVIAGVVIAFGSDLATATGSVLVAAWTGVSGAPDWAVIVTMLALFAVGGYIGFLERKQHESTETFDVR